MQRQVCDAPNGPATALVVMVCKEASSGVTSETSASSSSSRVPAMRICTRAPFGNDATSALSASPTGGREKVTRSRARFAARSGRYASPGAASR
ncbi:hypothetical protein WME94_34915 [Sorangium sp. So ce429]